MPRPRFSIAWLMGLVLCAALGFAFLRTLNGFEFALLLCALFSLITTSLYFYAIFALLRWLFRTLRKRRQARITADLARSRGDASYQEVIGNVPLSPVRGEIV